MIKITSWIVDDLEILFRNVKGVCIKPLRLSKLDAFIGVDIGQ